MTMPKYASPPLFLGFRIEIRTDNRYPRKELQNLLMYQIMRLVAKQELLINQKKDLILKQR